MARSPTRRRPGRPKKAPSQVLREHLDRIVELAGPGEDHKAIVALFESEYGFHRETARSWLRKDEAFRAALMEKGVTVDPGSSGRHEVVSEKVRANVLRRVSEGADVIDAFAAEEVRRDAARRWLKKHPEFVVEVEDHRPDLEAQLLKAVQRSALSGADPAGARWLLERIGDERKWASPESKRKAREAEVGAADPDVIVEGLVAYFDCIARVHRAEFIDRDAGEIRRDSDGVWHDERLGQGRFGDEQPGWDNLALAKVESDSESG